MLGVVYRHCHFRCLGNGRFKYGGFCDIQSPQDCCDEVEFEVADFNQDYSAFLGRWQKDNTTTNKGKRPVYRKVDNSNLFLASAEVL